MPLTRKGPGGHCQLQRPTGLQVPFSRPAAEVQELAPPSGHLCPSLPSKPPVLLLSSVCKVRPSGDPNSLWLPSWCFLSPCTHLCWGLQSPMKQRPLCWFPRAGCKLRSPAPPMKSFVFLPSSKFPRLRSAVETQSPPSSCLKWTYFWGSNVLCGHTCYFSLHQSPLLLNPSF